MKVNISSRSAIPASARANSSKQLLYYAEGCGDTCVVLDSKLKSFPSYTGRSALQNPLAERCEVTDEADAVSVMRALYPTHPTNPYAQFFDDQACKIAAYLLTYSDQRPSCSGYAYWLARPEEIFEHVAGSEHADA
jgi:hypothetical protein